MSTLRRARGDQAEETACRLLQKQGLRCIQRNYSCKSGEIDLIMEIDELLIFVEVRYRENDRFMSAVESVSLTKQRRIGRAAEHFLLYQPRYENHDVRFDVVGIEGDPPKIDWIKNAFEVE